MNSPSTFPPPLTGSDAPAQSTATQAATADAAEAILPARAPGRWPTGRLWARTTTGASAAVPGIGTARICPSSPGCKIYAAEGRVGPSDGLLALHTQAVFIKVGMEHFSTHGRPENVRGGEYRCQQALATSRRDTVVDRRARQETRQDQAPGHALYFEDEYLRGQDMSIHGG